MGVEGVSKRVYRVQALGSKHGLRSPGQGFRA